MRLKAKTKNWVEISGRNLLHNLDLFKKISAGKTVVCVVKANAYGHGLKEVAGVLKGQKGIWFGVDSAEEALQIRKIYPSAKILILGYVPLLRLEEVIESGISFVVYDGRILRKIISSNFSKKAKVHVKLETGLNRQGVREGELLRFCEVIRKSPAKILFEGVSTHFADVEDTENTGYFDFQLGNFVRMTEALKKEGYDIPFVHTAASASAMLFGSSHFNMIRVGIGLYGLWPSQIVRRRLLRKGIRLSLKPALSWKCIVVQVKEVGKGQKVGYGGTWTAGGKRRIAVLAVGYSDGYDRHLSNCFWVSIKGRKAPVAGRVAMNMIVVDVTNCPDVRPEDEAVLLGAGKYSPTADDMAQKLGTINYEVVARINPLVERTVV